jgi:hypothetical protein
VRLSLFATPPPPERKPGDGNGNDRNLSYGPAFAWRLVSYLTLKSGSRLLTSSGGNEENHEGPYGDIYFLGSDLTAVQINGAWKYRQMK